ncbi:hypothetical protein Bbelb_316280 [Branchiostoma belcheri]|nr:hypothetical protein Bbelb_316280 [Branchiostoma belcheri]
MLVIGIETKEDTWAIKLAGGPELARRVSSRLGLKLVKQIFGDYYLLEDSVPYRRNDDQIRALLSRESLVEWFKKQIPRKRYLRAVPNFNDAEWNKQSYLVSAERNELVETSVLFKTAAFQEPVTTSET